jgi:DNA primase
MLSEDTIARIRESVDLVALISEHVPLRRQGARFVGLCPFHTEKSPSFGVSRGKNFYYCFGCQASGDAIGFLRHVEGLGFMEAVQKLAERAGIELPRSDDPEEARRDQQRARRERLAEIMARARSFFEECLARHPDAAIAREELERRAVGEEMRAQFHLGYAPSGWDALAQHLEQQHVDLREAAEVGLIAPRQRGGGYYDRFRHRLMFPVADHHGRVVAFSGRLLRNPEGVAEQEGAPAAKYINSPESPLYRKGSVLFGLSEARVAVRKANRAVLCEGNFDLVALHGAGLAETVAPLGTAFTLDQARLLRRFTEEVVVMFDGDGAGRKATHAAIHLLQQAGLRGRAVRLPQGHDPDTFLRERGASTLLAMVQSAPSIVDFAIDDAVEAGVDAASRAQAIEGLGPLLASVESPVERDFYVQRVAQRFGVRDTTIVRASLRRGVLAARGRRDVDRPERPQNPAQNARISQQAPQRRPQDLPQRQREVVEAALDCPELLHSQDSSQLVSLLTDPDLRAIFLAAAQVVEGQGRVDALALLEAVGSNPARGWLAQRLEAEPVYSRERAYEVLQQGLPLLERDRKAFEREQLKRDIQTARECGDFERANELTRLRDELAKT